MHFSFLLFVPVVNYNSFPLRECHWKWKKKNPIFKISQTSFDLSRSIAAKLNACGQLKGLSKVFFPNFGFPEGNGNPLRYSRLENPVDGRAW